MNGNGLSIPLKSNSSQEKELVRNKTEMKQQALSTGGGDYTPREPVEYQKPNLKLPSPLRVKNYLRIKKPTSIVEEKNYEI